MTPLAVRNEEELALSWIIAERPELGSPTKILPVPLVPLVEFA